MVTKTDELVLKFIKHANEEFVLYLTCNNPTTQKKEHCQSTQFFANNVTEYELA